MKKKAVAMILGLTMLYGSSLSCLAASNDYTADSFGGASTEVKFAVTASDLGADLIVSIPSEINLTRVKNIQDPSASEKTDGIESGYYAYDEIFASGMVASGKGLQVSIADDGFANETVNGGSTIADTPLVFTNEDYKGWEVYFTQKEQGFISFRHSDSALSTVHDSADFTGSELRGNVGRSVSDTTYGSDEIILEARIADSHLLNTGSHGLTLTYNITVVDDTELESMK